MMQWVVYVPAAGGKSKRQEWVQMLRVASTGKRVVTRHDDFGVAVKIKGSSCPLVSFCIWVT